MTTSLLAAKPYHTLSAPPASLTNRYEQVPSTGLNPLPSRARYSVSSSSSTHSMLHSDNFTMHPDPEMCALRNMLSAQRRLLPSYASTPQSSAGLPTVTAVGRVSPLTNRYAYVEALVDTNALAVESIWYSTNLQCTRTAVVPLRTFIQEVLKRSRTTYSTLQTALFYLIRAQPAIVAHLHHQEYNQTKDDRQGQWEDAYISCGRRMFLASLVVASKFVQDKTYRNSAWAKIAGLPVAEINAAERIFLQLIDYRLYIAQSTFEQWHHLLHVHVEARTQNQPVPLHDLSCLPFGTSTAPSSTSATANVTPTSPCSSSPRSRPGWTLVLSPTSFLPRQKVYHHQHHHPHSHHPHHSHSAGHHHHHLSQPKHHHPYHHHPHHHPSSTSSVTTEQDGHRTRSTGYDDRRSVLMQLSPPLSCSPYSMNSTCGTCSPNTHIPPVLSLSLPSSSNSSPMQTPTLVSPVRVNHSTSAFTWKIASPTVHYDPHQHATHYPSRYSMPVQETYGKRKSDYDEFHRGYAVSYVRQTKRSRR
ncbi:uncharacterized protein BYT42DRAFT_565993 [Radiomyces spectabilis]|uniref:uncharacterized protein n=1 Tax=Radiomyces spectabilis TaxID=64574 RepID=UPI00221E618E|nr:uncharacterized protein BYT42DRAFT_565993 [Radiomyces spectabilis]KAI8381290.1 hypothetical protein BYT42DRAFT_565993 [Radiomyces spectabilis]